MKSQNWVETQAIVQSPHKKLIFGNSGQNLRNTKYQSFWSCSILLDFLTFSHVFCTDCRSLNFFKFISQSRVCYCRSAHSGYFTKPFQVFFSLLLLNTVLICFDIKFTIFYNNLLSDVRNKRSNNSPMKGVYFTCYLLVFIAQIYIKILVKLRFE